jgi:cytochrome b subunit of formate dehydrogenase
MEEEKKENTIPSLNELKEEITLEIEKELIQELSLSADELALLKAKIVESVREKVADEIETELLRIKKEKAQEEKRKVEALPIEYYERFSLNIRIQHIVLMISVLILIFSGLPIKFHDSAWAQFLFTQVTTIETTRLLHRIGATIMIVVAVYHLLYILFTRDGRENFQEVMPRFKDAKAVIQMIKYFLGKSKEKPKFGKYTYIDKFDYWAVYWGMVIMVLSGLLLWFLVPALYFLPKFIVDAAKEAHSDEALLATTAIVIWHFYNVHLNPEKFPMDKVWLSGKLTKEEMLKGHLLQWEKIRKEKLKKEE